MTALTQCSEVAIADLRAAVERVMARPAWRFGHQTARALPDGSVAIEVLLLDTARGQTEIVTAKLPAGATTFPSLTPRVPAAHWAERAIFDFFGLRAEGHRRWKGLLLHEAWPEEFAPLRNASDAEPSEFAAVTRTRNR